jgi:hypothetical protein
VRHTGDQARLRGRDAGEDLRQLSARFLEQLSLASCDPDSDELMGVIETLQRTTWSGHLESFQVEEIAASCGDSLKARAGKAQAWPSGS